MINEYIPKDHNLAQGRIGTKAMAMEKLTYTVEEAGELLGVSRNNIYNLVKNGRVPVIKLGKRLLVPKAALERLLASAGTAST